MNSAQLHLALTHVPVLLSITGLIMLIMSFLIKSRTLTKTSYIIITVAGIAAIPVYLTGEETEEVVENLPGVSEAIISKHEQVANLAMTSIMVAALMALIAFFSFNWLRIARLAKIVVLVFAVATAGLMAQTAHLGGQIRHSEIRNGAIAQQGEQNGDKGSIDNKGEQGSDKDDD